MNALLNQYSHVFEGIAKHNSKQVKLHIDETIKLVTSPRRQVPIHLREKFDKLLLELQAQDIIENVPRRVKWMSNTIPAPKDSPDGIQFTVNMTNPNKVIKQTRTVVSTIEYVKGVFRGAT